MNFGCKPKQDIMGKIASNQSKTTMPSESSSSGAPSPADLDNSITGDDHLIKMPVEIGHPHPDYFRVSSNCIKYGFEDVFMEPASIRNGIIGKHLSPHLNVVFGCVFNGTLQGLYFFMTMIGGIFAGFMWGFFYAIFIFGDVWLIQPANVFILAIIHSVVTPIVAMIRSVMDPVFQSCGLVFASISVSARLNMQHYLRTGSKVGHRRNLAGTLTRYDSETSDWLGVV